MKNRITFSVAIVLSFILGTGPWPILASNKWPPSPTAARTTTYKVGRGGRENAKLVKSPVLSKVLAKRPQQVTGPTGSLPGQTSTLLPDGRLLKLGGFDQDGPLATAMIEDSRKGDTTILPNELHRGRAWHTATMLPDGKILVLGGVDGNGQVADDVEVFDPETQTSEILPSTGLTPRVYHTATLLTEGQVLIAGGVSSDGTALRKAEVWDFRTRTVIRISAKLRSARYNHTATLLPSGKVLLSGGADNDGRPIREGEEYTTVSRRFKPAGSLPDQQIKGSPRLKASLPVDGATNVPVDSFIALRFSEALRVESLNSEAITLTGPYGPAITKVIPAEGGRLAFITPQSLLLPGITYTLSVAGPVDSNNVPLNSAALIFTTAAVQSPANQLFDDEEWIPEANNLGGNWRSNRPESQWSSLAALQAPPGVTALAGQSLKLNGEPLPNVTLQIGDRSTRTDQTGRFLLTDLTSGHQVMIIDGRTASRAGKNYGVFKVGIAVKPGQTNVLPYTIWMAKLDMARSVNIPSPTTVEMVITNRRIPNLELHLPAQTVIRDIDGQNVTRISLTAIPVDRPPFPLPPGVNVPVFFTVQPGGSVVIPPRARIIYPNFTNEAAGARINFWNYDPTEKGWYVYGQGTVSADKKQIIPDPGVVIYEFSGIMISTANRPDGPPCDCNAWDGDPVHLGTGLFVLNQTDLVLPDVLPIGLARTYRPGDSGSYSFGIGATCQYDLMMYDAMPNGERWKEVYVIMPDGGRFRYDRISPGTGFTDSVLEHTGSPSAFHKSRITWNGLGWDVTLKDGTVFVFGDAAPLRAIRDRYGNQVTIFRASTNPQGSPTGNMTRVTSANGRWIEFTYDGSNRITQAKDNTGRIVGYTYDGSGRLWKVTDAGGGVTEYSYDGSHRMLTIKDARGIVYLTNEYDSNGRVIKQTQADSTTYLFAYTLDGNGKVTQAVVTNPRGYTRTVTFNSSGYTLTDTRCCGGGQSSSFERQAGTNFVLSRTDALNRRTSFSYDSMGNVTSVTSLAGTAEAVTTSFTYEPWFNQVATVTDPLNHTTTYTYDSKGSLIRVTDPLTNQTTFTYNSAGLPLSATNAVNKTTQYEYDGADLSAVINPLGHRSSRFIDAAGRLLSVTNPLGQVARFEYDALNRPTRAIDPLQGTTQFSYDANGNLLTVTDARNNVTTYTYDSMDRLATRRDPLLRQESYLYDANGNLRQVTDRKSQVTGITYDSHDRPSVVTYQDGSTTTYNYDNGNRVTSVVDSVSGTISYTYDNLDRVTSKTTPQGTVSYTYDAASRMTSMTVAGQPAVSYTYDNADRLTQITQGTSTVTIAYDNADRRTSLTLANGVVTEYGYDNASRLTSLVYKKSGVTLGNLTYEYDASGRRTKVGGSYARTGLPAALSTASYNAANHQTAFGSQTLTYDLNGNLTSDGTNTYSWNARDQLVSMSGPGLSASFQYDASGRRVSKTINGTTTSFLYDGANIVQEKQGATVTANILSGGIDEVFSRAETASTHSPVADGLGSILSLTDSSGTVQTQYTYEPFGKTTASGPASNNPSQYTARENDGTGLYYYRARYYSPSLQRFISEDPIGFASGDKSFYVYVGNNPINKVDPTGLDDADRAFEESVNPPAPSNNPWYWSHNESADNQLGGRKPDGGSGAGSGDLAGLAICSTIALPARPGSLIIAGCAAITIAIGIAITANPPGERRGKSTWTCIARGHVNNFGNVPNVPGMVEATGTGPDQESASKAALDACSAAAPARGTYVRHCHIIRCWRN